MASPQPTPFSVAGEEDSAKRRQILDGARAVFMNLGFDGASMGEIARAAGVSKGTLYVYFTDKSALFEAIVAQEVLEQGKLAFNFDPGRDTETTLQEFGTAYIQLLCRPGGGSSTRTVMAIAERMPEVGSVSTTTWLRCRSVASPAISRPASPWATSRSRTVRSRRRSS